jgi:Ca2+-binding RTX toxin-like protein
MSDSNTIVSIYGDYSTMTTPIIFDGATGAGGAVTGTAYSDVFNGGSAAELFNGAAGEDTFIGAAGDDTFTGGDGADVFVFGSPSTLLKPGLDRDIITDFVTGTDKLSISSAGTVSVTYTGSSAVLNVNNNGTITLLNVNYLSTADIELIGGGSFVFNGSSGADLFNGGKGDDTFIGALGSDTLTGGAGNDVFVYNGHLDGANPKAANTNPDFIGDYNPSEDKLLINKTGFGIGVGVNPAQTLVKDLNFTTNSLTVTGAVVAYDTSSGNVWFFQDGSNSQAAGKGILLANLTNKPSSIQGTVQFF